MHNLFTQKNLRSFYVFFFFFSLYLLFITGSPSVDSYASFMTAKNIVQRGTLALSEEQAEEKNLSHRGGVVEHGVRVGKKYYSKYGIGWAVLMIPFYIVGTSVAKVFSQINPEFITLFVVCTMGPFVTALFLTYLYRFCLLLKFSENISLATVTICAFSTIIPFYSRGPNVETLDALLILILVYQIYLFFLDTEEKHLIYAGLTAAFLITTKVYNVIILLPTLTWLVWVSFFRNKENLVEVIKRLILFLMPVFPFVLIVLFLNYLRFGSFLNTGYVQVTEIIPIYQGLYGFLFSYGKSIFIYNPVLILAVISMGHLIKRNEHLAIGIGLIFLMYMGFLSFFPFWMSGPWGTRYLLPVISLMMLVLPFGLKRWSEQTGRIKKAILILMIFSGFLINLPSMLIDAYKWEMVGKNTGAFSRYEMTYQPKLSQIVGSWRLLISSFNKTIKGKSDWLDAKDIGVTFQKDCRVGSVVNNGISLDKYDESDIWFLRILRGRVTKYDGTIALLPEGRVLRIISVVAVFFLLFLALVSCLLYRKSFFQFNPLK